MPVFDLKSIPRPLDDPCRLVSNFILVSGILWGLAPSKAAAGGATSKPLPASADYRHVHRAAATDLFAGKADAAADWCQQFLQANPTDAEAWFLLSGARAQLNQMDQAQQALEHALQAGLPPGRFLAGPRAAFEALVQADWFQELIRTNQTSPILHGPMLGDLTDGSVKVWVRTAFPLTVRAVATNAVDKTVHASAPLQTGQNQDFTAVLQIEGMKPETDYRYWIEYDGPSGPAAVPGTFGTFRTRPARGAPVRFTIAFGGGAAYKPDLEFMWGVIQSRRPDAFLALGDNIYHDAPKDPDYQRYLYYRRQSVPSFRELVAHTPVYAIYDDHDFGTDDCSGGPDIEVPAWKRGSWRIFQENWVNPYFGGGQEQPGCWFDFSIADVDCFMLDGRYYRTNPKQTPASERSMLGPTQKSWLLDKLQQSRATFKVLVSGVPWAHGTKPGSLDTWDGFDQEREELFSLISKKRIEGVLLLSADRHRHDIWRIERPGAYPLFEFESSKITNVHTHPTMKRALFSYNKLGFALIRFDTTQPDPTITLQFIGDQNQVIHTFELRHSQLAWAKIN